MSETTELNFKDFLELFPDLPLPVMFTPDTYRNIEVMENRPILTFEYAKAFLYPEGSEPDEFTELMSVGKIKLSKTHWAVVWWRGDIEGYTYQLDTFGFGGSKIGSMVLAGTFYNESGISYDVAHIGLDRVIFLRKGLNTLEGNALLDENAGTEHRLSVDGEGIIKEV